MQTKFILIALLFFTTGCQQKSEIDKCVDAKALSKCKQFDYENKETVETTLGGGTEQCLKVVKEQVGGQYREECLRAASGK